MSYLQPIAFALRLQALSLDEAFPAEVRDAAAKLQEDVTKYMRIQDELDSLLEKQLNAVCKHCGKPYCLDD